MMATLFLGRRLGKAAVALFSLVLGLAMRCPAQPDAPGGLPPPNTTAARPPSQDHVVHLHQLIREALLNNPSIQASRRNAEAKKALILPARTLPDPVLGFQTMGNIVPPTLQEGDPSSARTFSIEQEVPFPGKLSLKGKMAAMEAEVEKYNVEQVRRQVIAELKSAYYDLYLIHRSIEVVQYDKELLQTFAQIAEEKYRVGQGIQQDVLKAHLEISRLIDRHKVLEQRRGSTEARIASLLNRPTAAPLGKPAEVKKARLHHSLEELNRLARENYPLLIAQEREIERSSFAVDLSKKEFFPDFTLGFTYFDRTVPQMYGIMFNVKVPLYFWRKQQPELESATASLDSARNQRDSIVAAVYSRIKDGYLVATTSEQLIDLYKNNVIPQARLALESAVANYQVGNIDFLTLLDSVVTLLEYELKYHETLADYQKDLAQLEPYVGVELTE